MPVISEHAIPFALYDWEETDSRNPEKEVILVDEASYFGTTFGRVYDMLKAGMELLYGREKWHVRGKPVLLSERSRFLLNEKKLDWLEGEIEPMKEEEVSDYVGTLVEGFLTLGKPYDIEFPILYADMPTEWREQKDEWIANRMKELLDGIGDDTSAGAYILEHRLKAGNVYTVVKLLSKDVYANTGFVHSDFTKVRGYWDWEKGRISFTFYDPRILEEDFLREKTPLFAGTRYETVWSSLFVNRLDRLKSRIREEREKRREEEQSLEKAQMLYSLEELEYHMHRSLVVWANYLYSFNLALAWKGRIEEGLAGTLELEKRDLVYLGGETLAGEVLKILGALTGPEKLPAVPVADVDTDREIPELFRTAYEDSLRKMPAPANGSQLVSALFYRMHEQVEVASRRETRRVIDLGRLRFGETFGSLYWQAVVRGLEKPLLSVHKAVDFRIDNGSMVPKYVRRGTAWIRMFRCGENEDFFEQRLLRFVHSVLRELSKKNGTPVMQETLIRAALMTTLVLPADRKVEGVFAGLNLPWQFQLGMDLKRQFLWTEFLDEAGEKTSLFDYCVDRNLLVRTEVPGYYKINLDLPASVTLEWVSGDVSLTLKVEERMRSLLGMLVELHRNNYREAYQWLFYTPEIYRAALDSLKDWGRRYSQLPEHLMTDSELVTSFNELNLMLPKDNALLTEKLQQLCRLFEMDADKTESETLPAYWLQHMQDIQQDVIFQKIRKRVYDLFYFLMCRLAEGNGNRERELQYADLVDEKYDLPELVEAGDWGGIQQVYGRLVEDILNI